MSVCRHSSMYLAVLTGVMVALLFPAAALSNQQPSSDVIETPVAIQPFQHGFLLWRRDNGQITVAFTEIRTKTGAPCQEVYFDTYQGQQYAIPPAPPGLMTPILGFGWLYSNDQELARRLGYATTDEVTLVAQVGMVSTSNGPVLQFQLSEGLTGFSNPLTLAFTDEPGLTYCFARRSGSRAELNTWVAMQRFEYGEMRWRQDHPDRIEVVHHDTDLAPEISCMEVLLDTWRPGEELSYGSLAVPNRFLPERGFGKIWLQNQYVRESLGYPVELETGGFAELTFEPFHHPRRGDLLVRNMVVYLPNGEEATSKLTVEGGGSGLEADNRLGGSCRSMLISHDH